MNLVALSVNSPGETILSSRTVSLDPKLGAVAPVPFVPLLTPHVPVVNINPALVAQRARWHAALQMPHKISLVNKTEILVTASQLLKYLKLVLGKNLVDIRLIGSTAYSTKPSTDLDLQIILADGFDISSCKSKVESFFKNIGANASPIFEKLFLSQNNDKATLSLANLDLNFITAAQAQNEHQYFELYDGVYVSLKPYLSSACAPNLLDEIQYMFSNKEERAAYLDASLFATKQPEKLGEPVYTFIRFNTKYKRKSDVQPGTILNFMLTEARNIQDASSYMMYFTMQLNRVLDNHYQVDRIDIPPQELKERLLFRIVILLNIFEWIKESLFLTIHEKKNLISILKGYLKNELGRLNNTLALPSFNRAVIPPLLLNALDEGSQKTDPKDALENDLLVQVKQLVILLLSEEHNNLLQSDILQSLKIGDWLGAIFHIFLQHPGLHPKIYMQTEVSRPRSEKITAFLQGTDALISRGLQLPVHDLFLENLRSFVIFLEFENRKTANSEGNKRVLTQIIHQVDSFSGLNNNYELLKAIFNELLGFYQNRLRIFPLDQSEIKKEAYQSYTQFFLMLNNLKKSLPFSDQIIFSQLTRVLDQLDNNPQILGVLANLFEPHQPISLDQAIQKVVEKINLGKVDLKAVSCLLQRFSRFTENNLNSIVFPLLEGINALPLAPSREFQDLIQLLVNLGLEKLPQLFLVDFSEARYSRFVQLLRGLNHAELTQNILAKANVLHEQKMKELEATPRLAIEKKIPLVIAGLSRKGILENAISTNYDYQRYSEFNELGNEIFHYLDVTFSCSGSLTGADMNLLRQLEKINSFHFNHFITQKIGENKLALVLLYLSLNSEKKTEVYTLETVKNCLPVVTSKLALMANALTVKSLNLFSDNLPRLLGDVLPQGPLVYSEFLKDIILNLTKIENFSADKFNLILGKWQQNLTPDDLFLIAARLFTLDPDLKNRETKKFIKDNFQMACVYFLKFKSVNIDAFLNFILNNETIQIPEEFLMNLFELASNLLPTNKFVDFLLTKIPVPFLQTIFLDLKKNLSVWLKLF
ncbi:MAG: hypothetical protein WC860_02850 [Candidatus Margulisiibacteriota bacterium]|jgi:hypothetical protein